MRNRDKINKEKKKYQLIKRLINLKEITIHLMINNKKESIS